MPGSPSSGNRLVRRLGAAALLGLLIAAPVLILAGCMTPEDKAFYGRGWINPSELDQSPTPPSSTQTPTSIEPHMMGPGQY